MSKSLNNFILAHELREKYSSNIIRIGMLKTHYRLPLDLTDTLFNESSSIDEKINNALKGAKLYIDLNDLSYENKVKDETFEKYMDDDFNTSNVVTYLLELVKVLNNKVRSKDNTLVDEFARILTISDVLGLSYELKDLTEEDKEIYNEWINYRNEKNFEKADELRSILKDRNIL